MIGTTNEKKAINWTVLRMREMFFSTFLLPKIENESVMYCSNETRNICTRIQSPIAILLSKIFYTAWGWIFLKSGYPFMILTSKKTISAILATK